MTSQRTIRSDAFDFLFDSQNLNPERIQEEIEKDEKQANEENLKKSQKNSSCCIIS